MGYFIKKDQHGTEGFVLPSGPTADRPATPILASARFNTDTNSIEYFNGTNFVDIAKSGNAEVFVEKITSDGVSFTYSMVAEHNDHNEILVFIDGILQLGPGNFDVAGFDITFTSAPPVGLKIAVVHGIGNTHVTDINVFDVPNL